jgi:exopolyphosphatase / guanosine-5'-triphosphate,3'-diphosphate pyrophosphatase
VVCQPVSTQRLAAIDCGTNTIRLLIVDLAEDGSSKDLIRTSTIVRLGQGVDRTGQLSAASLNRAEQTLQSYRDTLDKYAVTQLHIVATSAIRDAANAEEFLVLARRIIGITPRIISGTEEARLSYIGATSMLPANYLPPYLVVDIGGGSTELVVGFDRETVAKEISLDIGAVRLTERYIHNDPPTQTELSALKAEINRALQQAQPIFADLAQPTVLGVGGTVLTIAALSLGAIQYTPMLGHDVTIPSSTVEQLAHTLSTTTHAARAEMTVIEPGRLDIIGAGAMILHEVLAVTGASKVVASENDLLDGLATSAF